MITPFAYLIYRLFMRFPALVIIVYCVNLGGSYLGPEEAKVVEKLEREHITHVESLDLERFEEEEFDAKKLKTPIPQIIQNEKEQKGYVVTAYKKLYVIHGSLLLDRCHSQLSDQFI